MDMHGTNLGEDRGRAVASLMNATEISSEDVARLRRLIFSQTSVGRDEAEALFLLERGSAAKCREWTAFFVEAITDHIVWQARPTGVVNTPQAEWLIQEADKTRTLNTFAVLVNVLAEAHRVPAWLPAAVKGRAGAGWQDMGDVLEAVQKAA